MKENWENGKTEFGQESKTTEMKSGEKFIQKFFHSLTRCYE